MKNHNLSPILYPKRSLGQNFLTDPNTARWIVKQAGIAPGDHVIEIGPGKGMLTRALLETGARITAIEKDKSLCEYLERRFAGHVGLTLIEADAIHFPWETIADKRNPAILVGNLPYNAATQILWNLLNKTEYFKKWQFLFQKEVAERLCAVKGSASYGALSVFTQSVTRPTLVRIFPPKFFFPPPKVDSALVSFEMRPRAIPAPMEDKIFVRVVKAAFSHRRKMLRNNLKPLFDGDARALASFLSRAGIPDTLRAQDLSVADYLRLSREYSEILST